MGKASRNKRLSARERVAAQREAARRAERRRMMFITGGSVLGVVAIVVVLIVVATSGKSAPGRSGRTALPATVSRSVTGVPASTLAAVGRGSVPAYSSAPVTPITGAPLVSNGKPEMLYIGAEYCPYCAAMRWSMAIALSRFGALTTPLYGIHSSSTDVFPSTATLTFYKTGYSSKYLAFTAVENLTVNRSLLQAPTKEQNQIWARYEPDPQTRGYPFIDFGNKLLIKAPLYDPAVLKGLTWSQIASAMQNPSSPVAQGVDGAANYMTAAICKTTGNQPAAVCSAPTIKTLAGGL